MKKILASLLIIIIAFGNTASVFAAPQPNPYGNVTTTISPTTVAMDTTVTFTVVLTNNHTQQDHADKPSAYDIFIPSGFTNVTFISLTNSNSPQGSPIVTIVGDHIHVTKPKLDELQTNTLVFTAKSPVVSSETVANFYVVSEWTTNNNVVNSQTHPNMPVTIQFGDTTAPVFSGTPVITVGTVDANGANVTYTSPVATDSVDGDRPVSCTPTSGSQFSLGDTLVTCSASDTHGNTGTYEFHVVINDIEGPVLTLPNVSNVEATSNAGASVSFNPTALDAVDGSIAVSCIPASGSTFPIGPTQVSCSATDAANNTTTGNFTITVVDTTAPTITLSGASAITLTLGDAYTDAGATASDIVDGDITSKIVVTGSVNTAVAGPYLITYNVTDNAGNNAGEVTRGVTVTAPNTQPPTPTPGSETSGGTGTVPPTDNTPVVPANTTSGGTLPVPFNAPVATAIAATAPLALADNTDTDTTGTTSVTTLADVTNTDLTAGALNAGGIEWNIWQILYVILDIALLAWWTRFYLRNRKLS